MSQEKRKILIAEDEPSLSEMYKLYFERAGYEVFHAENGQMCVEVAEKNPPDIILLDILMPRVNGWEVLEKLKKNDKTKNIPVLIFSNLAQADEIQKGLDLGADEYLVKSNLTPKELLVKIEKSLK
jgi:DNA-binding response OmpR family regulator